jgi:hypothetical protein
MLIRRELLAVKPGAVAGRAVSCLGLVVNLIADIGSMF